MSDSSGRGRQVLQGKRRILFSLVVGLALVTTACGGNGGSADEDEGDGQQGAEPRTVDVALPGGGVAFYGWFAAEALGYWEDEGLDVNLITTGGGSESAQLLATGEVHIAESSADALLQVMARADIYPFYNFWEQEFRRWVVPVDSAIQDVSELAGTTVGVTELAGGEVSLVKANLANQGILEDVEIVAVSSKPAAVLSAFEQDRIQSYAGETATLIAMEAQGVSTRSILPEGLEKGPISPTAASAEVKDDRDLLIGIARGVAKGSLFCITNVEACVDVIAQEHPEYVEDRALAIDTVRNGYIPITAPDQIDGRYRFGTTNTLENWQLYVDVYSSGPDPAIPGPENYDLPALVIEITDEINDFDYDAVVQEAENWTP